MGIRGRLVEQRRLRSVVPIMLGLLAAIGIGVTEGKTSKISKGSAGRVVKVKSADVVVLFTGSTRGNFEPCGCGGRYDGGLSRRATLIDGIRKVNRSTVLVDTGDLTNIVRPSLQMEFLGQAYQLLGYDAILPGAPELRLGLEKLDKLAAGFSLPLVLTNVKSKQPAGFRQVITVVRGGNKIAVIAVIAKRHFDRLPRNIRNQLAFETPEKAISRMTAELAGRCDAIVLLSQFTEAERKGLIGKMDGVTLWIDHGKRPPTRRSRKTDKTAQTQPTTRLDITPPRLTSWPSDQRIGLACLTLKPTGNRLIHTEMIKLAKRIKGKEKYLEIYDAYRYAARQAFLAKQTKPVKGAAAKSDFNYVPAEDCGDCHPKQFDFWSKTTHAHAFDILIEHKRADDPNCWACHSTGFREPSGFVTPEQTSELKHVACQMCHRMDLNSHPGEKTAAKAASETKAEADGKEMTKLQKRIKMRTKIVSAGRFDLTRSWHCQRCHVTHRSPKFKYDPYRKKIACPKLTEAPAIVPAGNKANR